METFSASLALYEENSPFTGEFPSQRPVARSFDVFFDLRLNKQLNRQSRRWWFETPSRTLWRYSNAQSVQLMEFNGVILMPSDALRRQSLNHLPSPFFTCAPRRSIVLQFFWHVDTRPISPFIFFFNSTFYLCIIIVIYLPDVFDTLTEVAGNRTSHFLC